MLSKTESVKSESERGKELSEVQEMCLWNLGIDDEQVAVRHAGASGGVVRETQHEEDRVRDVHIGKRGSEAAGEEQRYKLRNTVRFNKMLQMHFRLQIQL